MSPRTRADAHRAERSALLAAISVAVATSIHHAYGAIVYHTPWRLDAVVISALTVAVMLAALKLSRAVANATLRRVAWWTFWGVNAVVFVLLLGAFEGLYNHALKDLLYFGGAPFALMRALFPAPRYELPNNWFFEVTGVFQVVVAAISAIQLARLLPHRPRRADTTRPASEASMTARLAKPALWTIRLTGPVQVAVGIALWMGRAIPLRPAHMLVGVVFDLALVSLVVLGALAGVRRAAVLAGIALAVVVPVFGVVQARILPGPEHWVVRAAHLLLGIIAMVVATRLARFIHSSRTVAQTTTRAPDGAAHANAQRRVLG